MPEQAAQQIDQKWTDLQSHCNGIIDRNTLSAQLIHHLLKRLEQHQNEGLAGMLDEWHAQDFYLNKRVKLLTGERIVKGICRGVNNQGALMLEIDGQVSPIYGGEVSLRGNE
jgi:BirA family biotin operon repressor/biotin-[acetyl-CoA-carboxylase] ligase